jgi:hypothetical protein
MDDEDEQQTDDQGEDSQDASTDDAGEIHTVSGDDGPVTDTDDGGAIVKLADEPDQEKPGESDFYANLAEELDQSELSKLAIELLDRIERDKESRKERDEIYAEGIKRTGLGDEAPGGAAFVGASTAVHPMLAKATVYYQSHTIGELMPPGGPVKDDIVGQATKARVEKAQRKVAHMNWQFKYQMPEFRSQLEKLLSQQPLAGSQFLRLVYDSRRKKPVPTFFPIDKVYIPDSAADFYSAERRTFEDSITQLEFEERIRQGYYSEDMPLSAPAQLPEKSESAKASDKIEGKDDNPYNQDGLRIIYIVETYADIEGDTLRLPGGRPSDTNTPLDLESDHPPLPYLIELDVYSKRIVSIVRNWEADDKLFKPMPWVIEFPFIPWRGAYSAGLVQLIGSLAGGATGALRALLDSALVNNLPTLLKLKGSNAPGQTLDLNVGGITEIEGGVAGKDIRQVTMAVPFNPPSTMLYQLLGFLTEQGEDVVRTTFENLSQDGTPNMPVGTTLALIEQGMKVLAAIHLRLHHAMDKVIEVLARINRLYITDEEILDETGERLAFRSDYEGPRDVIPVSDPEVFSDIQRFAQLQVISQRAQLMPQLYDLRKVEELILQRTKIPNATDLLVPAPQVQETNQVNENLMMTMGTPVAVYPEQDHLAHIQILLDYLQSPMFGMLSIIAPKYIPPALQHLKDHMAHWYVDHFVQLTSAAAGADIGKIAGFRDKQTKTELDQTLAAASPHVMQAAAQAFTQIPQIIAKAQQYLQSLLPPPPQDPSQAPIAVAKINAGVKTQQIQQQAQQAQQESQQQAQADAAKAQSEMQQTILEQTNANQRTQAQDESHERINAADNATALEIAAAKVETGHSTNLSTGTSMGHESFGGV